MSERREKAQVLDATGIGRAITRIAHEIAERNKGVDGVVLIGLRSRGVELAHRIATKLGEIENTKVPVGALDITLYRDDFGRAATQPIVRRTEIPFSIDGKKVVLVDRGHRELPIRADYVGKNVPTSHQEAVQVLLTEGDGVDKVVIYEAVES